MIYLILILQDIGVSVGSSIISRNIFKGAEILEFGVKGSIGSSRDVAEEKSSFFNLFEVGLSWTKISKTHSTKVF